ncbi:tyrosine-protein kinase receptor TYRO3 isoform X1 [Erpetoichthys calabaricus]|uniref:Tyrosine-protein kinase receptor TYRO3 n=1 Tax=Erpetoichthys calabaricus TaxID=27687 RepID=A0A8C4TH02_ERPCA|nr:tyrosine-protein kinase receptor TYRO3 isoform X1 [Erpetoichthys calabaricus]
MKDLVYWLLVCTTAARLLGAGGVRFTKNPSNVTVSQGNTVKLECAVEALEEPDIIWMKDGVHVHSADQMFVPLDHGHWQTFYRIPSVQRADAGKYWCEVEDLASSDPAWMTVEGVPHFVLEPQDVFVLPDMSFNLTCAAVGPPEPVKVIWWFQGKKLEKLESSSSILNIHGMKKNAEFHCEAHNERGLAISRTARVHITALPEAPTELHVHGSGDCNASLSWKPGFNGYSELRNCTIQVGNNVQEKGEIFLEKSVLVPPYNATISGLKCFSNYSIRVSCSNEVGTSPISSWVDFTTPESVPSGAPQNLSFQLIDFSLVLSWVPLYQNETNGVLSGHKVQWNRAGDIQESLFSLATMVNLSDWRYFSNASLRVCACNAAGCGPWSLPVLVPAEKSAMSLNQRSHLWVVIFFGIFIIFSFLGLLIALFLRQRRKEMLFGGIFGPDTPDAQLTVSYTAARSFNRRGPEHSEITLDSLGISEELKKKLQDVLISESQLNLGHLLGKGEFSSVREAYLKMQDGSVKKVAVKVLKADVSCSSDIEQCLREAAYMKEFHHPNVLKLIGISLHRHGQQRLPVPMVILPFMKHGDLHTFLLMSRLGDNPFTLSLQTLLQFTLDVARGMEYLSLRKFIHRDLAARNCMLSKDMRVCVADFGLSKKIYSGDYYRQGSASKLPVKWIALESLADNIYTTQSDVWAFGVTVWEIMTLGQTPYPGVENSEVYEYLIKGNRLKQPPDCPDEIYRTMCRCWNTNPKERPGFDQLILELEAVSARLSQDSSKMELLYINVGNGSHASEEEVAGGLPWHQSGPSERFCDDLLNDPAEIHGAVGSDYRYIMDPYAGPEVENQSGQTLGCTTQPEDDEDEEDVFLKA